MQLDKWLNMLTDLRRATKNTDETCCWGVLSFKILYWWYCLRSSFRRTCPWAIPRHNHLQAFCYHSWARCLMCGTAWCNLHFSIFLCLLWYVWPYWKPSVPAEELPDSCRRKWLLIWARLVWGCHRSEFSLLNFTDPHLGLLWLSLYVFFCTVLFTHTIRPLYYQCQKEGTYNPLFSCISWSSHKFKTLKTCEKMYSTENKVLLGYMSQP